jgi:hypothetical protein
VRIFFDSHDRREAERAFVKRLAKVCTKHASQDPLVHRPEEPFAGIFVNKGRRGTSIGCSLAEVSVSEVLTQKRISNRPLHLDQNDLGE